MAKIILISPSLKAGGIERVMTLLANYSVQNGHQVIFISCIKAPHFYSLDSRIVIKETTTFSDRNSKLFRYLRLAYFIRKEALFYKPDSVMVFGDYFSPFTIMSLSFSKIPVYIADQMSPTYKFPIYIRFLKNLFYPLSSGIIAQTELSAKFARQRYGNKVNVKVIPNPLSNIKDLSIPKENFITIVSRIHFDKGIDNALLIWSKVKNRNNWKMVFAGGGELINQMIAFAKKLEIHNDVIFLGEIKDVPELLAKSKIFLFPSRSEGFPNALCEAMATPLPCICYESLNNPLIITKNNFDGILIEDGSIDDMALNLEMLMSDSEKCQRIANEAKAIRERLNINNIAPDFLNFILDK